MFVILSSTAPHRGRLLETTNAVATFCHKKHTKSVFLCYLLPSSFKIFINLFTFLYVKANYNEICEEITAFLLFQKNADVSVFEIQG